MNTITVTGPGFVLGLYRAAMDSCVAISTIVAAGVAETTLGVSGQEPPLVITGPGGDFRTEHRPCACCNGIFTAVAGGPGKYCQECLDRRAARRAEQEKTETDCGGVFDGTRIN